MNMPEWRRLILEKLASLYLVDDRAHGIDHAYETERLVIEIAAREEYTELDIDLTILRAAALLHDAGYTRADSTWSPGKVEHVREGVRIAQELLSGVAPFGENQQMLEIVCYLVLHHDDTNYSFPIKKNGYNIVCSPQDYEDQFNWSSLPDQSDVSLKAMVSILREADALLGAGESGALRTWEYSIHRRLPPVTYGNPLNAWAWEESALGNVRLAAKRALLDARTKEGWNGAVERYHESESFVAKLCQRNGIQYDPESGCIDLDTIKRNAPSGGCRLTRFEEWATLQNTLARTPLNGDRSLFPYAGAHIESRLLPLKDLSPLSRYVLKPQIELHKVIREALFANYALDVFDLAGIAEFTLPDRQIRIAPPIIECYQETQGSIKGIIWGLVDGLHRCCAARELGITHIRVVVISNIAPQFPLVPLPVQWQDVESVTQVPPQKRTFRFENGRDLQERLFNVYPSVYHDSPRPKSEEDAKYYLYRDLSALGSKGIRMSPIGIR